MTLADKQLVESHNPMPQIGQEQTRGSHVWKAVVVSKQPFE